MHPFSLLGLSLIGLGAVLFGRQQVKGRAENGAANQQPAKPANLQNIAQPRKPDSEQVEGVDFETVDNDSDGGSPNADSVGDDNTAGDQPPPGSD